VGPRKKARNEVGSMSYLDVTKLYIPRKKGSPIKGGGTKSALD